MANRQVWILFTKSEPLDGCSIDMDGCDFYFAEAYVPVDAEDFGITSFESILDRVKQSLLEDKLVLTDVSKCLRYNKEEWHFDSEMEKETHALAAKALSSGSIMFSGFKSEEIEELCRYHHGAREINI
jgi:hypothetical protein